MPTSLHVDAVIVYEDAAGSAALAVIVEVQRGRDPDKRRTWPAYVTHVGLRHDCPTMLLVVCPDLGFAGWCREPCETGHPDFVLRPLVLTPHQVPVVTDVGLAKIAPTLAVLSVISHGEHPEQPEIFQAVLAALESVDRKKAVDYYDIVLAGLPVPARHRWEEFMSTSVAQEFHSEFMRDLAAKYRAEGREEFRSEFMNGLAAKYRAEGEARGEARAVLDVLAARGLDVPDQVRDEILSCTDVEQLTTWVRRAATATSIDDLR